MTAGASATLFHPFDAGDLAMPPAGEPVLFLGARPGFHLPRGFDARLVAVQGFRPDFLALKGQGVDVTPEPEGSDFSHALVLAGRHRGQNEGWIGQAWQRVRANGLIIVAGAKEDGIDSLRKRVDQAAGIEGSLSKYHGIAFWLRKTKGAAAPFAPADQVIVDGRFATAPGMFSHERIDQGSRLLAEHLPANLSGAAADFCAGWGYLSAELLAGNPAIVSIELYEADYASLDRKSVV